VLRLVPESAEHSASGGSPMSSAVATYVHGLDPISQAGVISQLRSRPEIRIVSDADKASAQVAVVVADHVDDGTVRVLHGLRRDGLVRLVLIATTVDDAALVSAAEAGVGGLVRRAEATADALVRTIERVACGHGELPPDLLGRLLEQVGRLQRQVLAPRGLTFTGLTPRETEVLRLVADGHDTSEIASRLCYSERTVKNVLHDLNTRLQLRNRSQAVAYAVREGLI
jgi:DNA-binding NarL/FixJ family response regulator